LPAVSDPVDDRLRLWRNTIQLFHDVKSTGFLGPFKRAGFVHYRPEPQLKNAIGEDRRPDLVSVDDSGNWLALELTMDPKSKESQLSRYCDIDGRYLADYDLPAQNTKPDAISSRLEDADDGSFCKIVVNTVLEVRNEDTLRNQRLKNELMSARDVDLTRLPQLPITLVFESKGSEIRRGIRTQIMQLFNPNSQGTTAREVVDTALERLADVAPIEKKERLIELVKREMDGLVTNELSRYLEFAEGVYRSKIQMTLEHHAATRGRIGAILTAWAGEPRRIYSPKIDSYEITKGPP